MGRGITHSGKETRNMYASELAAAMVREKIAANAMEEPLALWQK
jgi:hypothetical protein